MHDQEPFQFLDPGPLIDGELELVMPDARWMDEMLATTRRWRWGQYGSLTRDFGSREAILRFLSLCPHGHQPGDPARGVSPAYHFWLRLGPESSPRLTLAGSISLRVGHTRDLEMYTGHIGYGVEPEARGHHYAERACRLLLPLARRHGLNPLWITCNPDNIPSRRTCERLGCILAEIVPVPREHLLYMRGDQEKCRYRLDL